MFSGSIYIFLLALLGLLALEVCGQSRRIVQPQPRRECSPGTICTYHSNCVTVNTARSSRRNAHQQQFCLLDNGFTGVCCQQVANMAIAGSLSSINNKRINVQRADANRFEQTVEQLEDELQRNHLVPPKNTLEFSHQNFFGVNRAVLHEMQKASQVLQAYIAYAKR